MSAGKLTEAEWSAIYATLPERPEEAEGWELSLVRRTCERVLAEREATLRAELFSVEQIRDAFAKHASPDDWGVPSFYEKGLLAALRGEYDTPGGDGA